MTHAELSRYISIHALCEEGDVSATSGEQTRSISIHALCEEGDPSATASRPSASYFYPRPLRGGRLCCVTPSTTTSVFLSTPSARRATCHVGASLHVDRISIHALCEEGDRTWFLPVSTPKVFLSTPSARRATSAMSNQVATGIISIHALCEEGDIDAERE